VRIRTALAAGFAGGAIAVAVAAAGIAALDDDADSGDSRVSQVTETPEEASENNNPGVALLDECQTASDIYETVRPSVVEVNVVLGGNAQFGGQGTGTGTGVILDEEGHILTNNHVVDGAQTVEVRFSDETTAIAEVVGSDPANDLAVIKVDPADADLVPATLGDSDELRVGDPVLAIGSPFNLEGTLTQGIVSALDRIYSGVATTRPIRDMIQTDAPINPGNSGGPLINCQGEVVGINTLLENPTGQSVNVGVAFAVAINTAEASLDEMIAGTSVEHPWLGVGGVDVSPSVVEEADLTVDSGVYLTLVSPGSPAEDAGLIGAFANEDAAAASGDAVPPGGDVITAADGEEMNGIEDLAGYLSDNKAPGDTVELTVVRDGEEITVTATLGEWPAS
jgi:S1-C subfamily serine protease